MSDKTLAMVLRGNSLSRILGDPDWSAKKVFGFHRRKDEGRWGFDVWLWLGQAGMNLTAYGTAPFARTKDEARGWVIAFAQQHGFQALERQRRPKEKARPQLRLVPPLPEGT